MRLISLFLLSSVHYAVSVYSAAAPYSQIPLEVGECQTTHTCKCNGDCPPVPPNDPNPDPPYTCHGTMIMREDPMGRRSYECHPNTPPHDPNPPPEHPNPNCNNMQRGYDPRACPDLPNYDPVCDYTKPSYDAGACCTTNPKCPNYDPRCDIGSTLYDPRECPVNGNYDPNCDHTKSARKCVDIKKCADHPRPCNNPYPDPSDPNVVWACQCGPGQRPTRQGLARGTCSADDGTNNPAGGLGGGNNPNPVGNNPNVGGNRPNPGSNDPNKGSNNAGNNPNPGGNVNPGGKDPNTGSNNAGGDPNSGGNNAGNNVNVDPNRGNNNAGNNANPRVNPDPGSNAPNTGGSNAGTDPNAGGNTGAGNTGQKPIVQDPPTDAGSGTNTPPANQCYDAPFNTFCKGGCSDNKFMVGDVEYTKSCLTRTPGTRQKRTTAYATPASCAEAECNNESTCFGVGWVQNLNVCHVHFIQWGRSARTRDHPNEHLIYKSSMSHLV